MLRAEIYSASSAGRILEELDIPFQEWSCDEMWEIRVDLGGLSEEELQKIKIEFFDENKVFDFDYLIFY
jgi:hypothetical protein